MLEYDHHKQKLEDRSPLLFRRSDFTALYSERGLIFVIGGNDAKSFYTACEKYDIQNDTWSRIAIEMYDIDYNMWRMVNLNAKSTWTACDLAMCMPIDSKHILIFGGFNK